MEKKKKRLLKLGACVLVYLKKKDNTQTQKLVTFLYNNKEVAKKGN